MDTFFSRTRMLAGLMLLLCLSGLAQASDDGDHYHRTGNAPSLTADDFGRAVANTLDSLRAPLDELRVNSEFGLRNRLFKTARRASTQRFHYGVDYGAPYGTPVYAAQDGTIEVIQNRRGFGNYVRLSHGHGVDTAYAHLSRFAEGLEAGDEVNEGEVIGYVGRTGRTTGPHLHFEVLVDGVPVDPERIHDQVTASAGRAQSAGYRYRSALP